MPHVIRPKPSVAAIPATITEIKVAAPFDQSPRPKPNCAHARTIAPPKKIPLPIPTPVVVPSASATPAPR
jgi:hypothetical protein